MTKKAVKIEILTILCLVLIVSIFTNTTNAITNGKPDGNNHPYVVLVVADINGEPAWRGTGILLSPTIVLTAGHVTYGATACRIWPDEKVEGNTEYPYGGETSYEGKPYTYPFFAVGIFPGLPGWILNDVGIIVLSERVSTSEVSNYGQLPTAGLSETLKIRTNIDFVGYGVQTNLRGGGQPEWTGLKNRYFSNGELLSTKSAMSSQFIQVSANPAQGKGGTAFGDSGGPALLGGTNTVLAVTSFGTNNNCAGTGYYCRIDRPVILEWINNFL